MMRPAYLKGALENAQDIAHKLLLILGVACGLSAAGTLVLLEPGEPSFAPLALSFSVAFFLAWTATASRWRPLSRPAIVVLLFALNFATQRFFGANFFVFATIAVVAVVVPLVLFGWERWSSFALVALMFVTAVTRQMSTTSIRLRVSQLHRPIEIACAGILIGFCAAMATVIDARRNAFFRRNVQMTEEHDRAVAHARDETRARIEATARAEAVRAMAAGLAHDLSNLLSVAMLVLPRVEREATSPQQRELLCSVREAVESGIALANSLKTIGRGLSQDLDVDLGDLFRQACDLVRRSAGDAFQLDLKICPAGPRVRGDPTRLYQVVFNLVHNAARAAGPNGRVRVTVEPPPQDGEPVVRVRVEDSGPGVPTEVRERIFEPYMTTRAEAGGSGLGLAVVAAGVQAHGGRIRLEGEGSLGGACFVVELPVRFDGGGLPARTPSASAGAPTA